MDSTCFPDWSSEAGLEFPSPTQRKPLGLDSELVELLWQNGQVVLQSQTHRKLNKQQKTMEINPNGLINDDETVSWIDCPIDESFEKEFCSDFLSEDKIHDFGPMPLPPPRFEALGKACNNESYSARTVGSSHCASNQVVNEEINVGAQDESIEEREKFGQPTTVSSSGGSGSSVRKTSSQSNETNGQKRKRMEGGDSDCRSDATELESGATTKSSQKKGRSRVAEVHNLSERRRRDRINEKLKALQELIPHSSKTDKASVLDEAIEYVKSLQSQLQLMWMGSGMASMMLPGVQHYMSRVGMGIAPPMLPSIQNLMHLSSRLPSMNTSQTPMGHRLMLNYHNQMQNPAFHANYMPFHSIPNNSQAINMMNSLSSSSAQHNQALAPPCNPNCSIG